MESIITIDGSNGEGGEQMSNLPAHITDTASQHMLTNIDVIATFTDKTFYVNEINESSYEVGI